VGAQACVCTAAHLHSRAAEPLPPVLEELVEHITADAQRHAVRVLAAVVHAAGVAVEASHQLLRQALHLAQVPAVVQQVRVGGVGRPPARRHVPQEDLGAHRGDDGSGPWHDARLARQQALDHACLGWGVERRRPRQAEWHERYGMRTGDA
jgi:hypothetical protein